MDFFPSHLALVNHSSDNNMDSRLQKEEAKIASWENLQKAKAEAAVRKLEGPKDLQDGEGRGLPYNRWLRRPCREDRIHGASIIQSNFAGWENEGPGRKRWWLYIKNVFYSVYRESIMPLILKVIVLWCKKHPDGDDDGDDGYDDAPAACMEGYGDDDDGDYDYAHAAPKWEREWGLGDGGVAAQIPVEESVQRDADGLEGVEVGEVGFGKVVPLMDCLFQEPTPVAAERHRREIVELGVCAAHCCFLHEIQQQIKGGVLQYVGVRDLEGIQAGQHGCSVCGGGGWWFGGEGRLQKWASSVSVSHCDKHLNLVSKQPDLAHNSPYFDVQASAKGSPTSSFNDMESTPAAQSSSDIGPFVPEHLWPQAPSPSSVMDLCAIEGNEVREDTVFRLNSLSMSAIVNHIGHKISERMSSRNASGFKETIGCQDMPENIAQILLGDTQCPAASNEKKVMSRVNSLCCLLQDPTAGPSMKFDAETQLEGVDHGMGFKGTMLLRDLPAATRDWVC
ncbi:hypothetical protein RHSIM_Rhsim01G0088400 [Rhododendron simsii]|uniref:Remorin C-terminal domain-containing protein n=1 Tax=Rhododendron simsii TaxID=118357 RepID=A0A834HJV6_RHOSS|nr:hypothetical protein RHSIM_Rhsim01G0088400 [Rhododendron simsii]